MEKNTKRLFVGGIPWKMSSSDLKTLFSKAGEVVAAEIVMDTFSGRSRGFAFVEFASPEEARHAIEMFNETKYGNLTLKVRGADPEKKTNEQPHIT